MLTDWPEPLIKILGAGGVVVILAVLTVSGVWLKNVAEAASARATAARTHADTAAAIAAAAQHHIAEAERRINLQQITFRLQARDLNATTVRLHALKDEREHDRAMWQMWARQVKAAQDKHYEWDQEVVIEIERLGGHVHPAPPFAAQPPPADDVPL